MTTETLLPAHAVPEGLYAPAPGQRDPAPSWDGGPDTIFATLRSL